MRILVVVASATGRTQRLATALAEGAQEAGAETILRSAEEATAEDAESADAIVLGSGVHMGGIESSMREFLERTSPLWLQGKLSGRLGAAFVSAGQGGRGGAELTLISLLSALAEHGLILVSMPNRLEGFAQAGSHWGPVSWTNPRQGEPGPTTSHLSAARSHGRHIAQCTARWLRGQLPSGE
jgi:NAD(P)H dehydrogenase (quinone)